MKKYRFELTIKEGKDEFWENNPTIKDIEEMLWHGLFTIGIHAHVGNKLEFVECENITTKANNFDEKNMSKFILTIDDKHITKNDVEMIFETGLDVVRCDMSHHVENQKYDNRLNNGYIVHFPDSEVDSVKHDTIETTIGKTSDFVFTAELDDSQFLATLDKLDKRIEQTISKIKILEGMILWID